LLLDGDKSFTLKMFIFDPPNGVCRRGRGAIGFEGVGCGERGWARPQKKSQFAANLISYFQIFGAVFNRPKTWTVTIEALHGTQILWFNCETKLTKQCKSYPKIHGQTGGGQSQPLNTPLNPPAPICVP